MQHGRAWPLRHRARARQGNEGRNGGAADECHSPFMKGTENEEPRVHQGWQGGAARLHLMQRRSPCQQAQPLWTETYVPCKVWAYLTCACTPRRRKR